MAVVPFEAGDTATYVSQFPQASAVLPIGYTRIFRAGVLAKEAILFSQKAARFESQGKSEEAVFLVLFVMLHVFLELLSSWTFGPLHFRIVRTYAFIPLLQPCSASVPSLICVSSSVLPAKPSATDVGRTFAFGTENEVNICYRNAQRNL